MLFKDVVANTEFGNMEVEKVICTCCDKPIGEEPYSFNFHHDMFTLMHTDCIGNIIINSVHASNLEIDENGILNCKIHNIALTPEMDLCPLCVLNAGE